jgi:DNA repair protein RecO (recombination protein O)
MEYEKSLAIVLQSIDYQEKSKIIKVFTKEEGVISLIAKKSVLKNCNFFSITSPFCKTEIIYQKKSNNIYLLKEANIMDEHLFIRDKLSLITSACSMARAVLDTQFFRKKAESIFLLFESYLKNITCFSNPAILSTSFLLKILLYENLISPDFTCSVCCNKNAYHLHNGESLCEEHAPKFSFSFSEEEYKNILVLTFSKKYSDLQAIDLTHALQEKINHLFKDML